MRGSQRREQAISASADRVWGIVGRPELIHLWFPGIVASRVDGDVRTITTGMGLEMVERILTNDPLQRRFQYRIDGGFFREHLGTVDVIEQGSDACLVVYSSDVDPAPLAVILGGATQGALAELARQVESGEGPAVDAIEVVEAGDRVGATATTGPSPEVIAS